MNLLDAFKKQESGNPGNYKEESFTVVGTQYYMKNIHRLARFNRNYWLTAKTLSTSDLCGQKIYKNYYINKPVKLIQEAHNSHDKNAVAVHIAGKLVGYISADENVHVRNILNKHNVCILSSFVGGGRYKVVSMNRDVDKIDQHLSIRVTIGYYKK